MTLALLLLAQCWLAGRFPPFVRVLFRFQALFWLISYCGRAVYLIVARPMNPDPIADPRLATTDYSTGLRSVLFVVLVGEVAFLVTMLVLSFIRLTHSVDSETAAWQMPMSSVVGLIAVGWLGRLGHWLHTASLNRALSPLALIGVGLFVLFFRRSGPRLGPWLVVVALSELLWSVASASKTPIISFLVAIVLRWSSLMSREQARRRVPAIVGLILGSFLAIQPIKHINTASQVAEYNRSGPSWLVGPAASVLERTDLLARVTDAYYYPRRPWLGSSEYLKQLAQSALIKGPGWRGQPVGALWNAQVTYASLANQGVPSGVSVANGTTAEGYVENGLTGTALESAVGCVITLLAGLALARRRVIATCIAGALVFGAGLYEEGLLSEVGALAKGIEAAAFVILFSALGRQIARRRVAGRNWRHASGPGSVRSQELRLAQRLGQIG